MNKKILSSKQFKEIYTQVPRLCVDLLIVDRKKVLLTKRSIPPFNGLWHFPGGSVWYGESLKKAISRVAKTELGIKVVPLKFLNYMEIPQDGYRHTVSLVFKCKMTKNQKPKPLEQASEIKFFDKALPKRIIGAQKKFFLKNRKEIFK